MKILVLKRKHELTSSQLCQPEQIRSQKRLKVFKTLEALNLHSQDGKSFSWAHYLTSILFFPSLTRHDTTLQLMVLQYFNPLATLTVILRTRRANSHSWETLRSGHRCLKNRKVSLKLNNISWMQCGRRGQHDFDPESMDLVILEPPQGPCRTMNGISTSSGRPHLLSLSLTQIRTNRWFPSTSR